jgi:hypothetical protein
MRVLFALLAAAFFIIPARAEDGGAKSTGASMSSGKVKPASSLKLDGVKGESMDDKHKGEIHIESMRKAGGQGNAAGSAENSPKPKK